MTEKERIATVELITGMAEDEIKCVLSCVPDKELWSELQRRFYVNSKIVDKLVKAIEGSENEKEGKDNE